MNMPELEGVEVDYRYRARFRSWRFYALFGFALLDFAIPFLPLGTMALLLVMFSQRLENRILAGLARAFYPEVARD